VIVRLGPKGRFFTTRSGGRELREGLEHILADVDPREPVYIDFRGVVGFDGPAADECFGKLLAQMREGGRDPVCLCLVNVSCDQAEHMALVLGRRNLCIPASGRWGWAIVGSIAQAGEEVIQALHQEQAPLRPAQLSALLAISGPAAGNRLRRLWLTGLLVRDELQVPHGWEYAYALPARLLRVGRTRVPW
jgi:hypothetical protein